jgi:squalene-hopene/tetraprenyl-beta-curcumene cyclase
MRIPLPATLMMLLALAWSAPLSAASEQMDPALHSKAKRATDRGLRFLRSTQAEDGSWSRSVGITALALRAFLESHRGYDESDGPFITRAVEFLRSHVREDGSISESIQNRNYNTATAITALQATNNPAHARIIENAQRFLRGLQLDEGEGYQPDHRYYGGIGYGGDERPDLSNQYLALEALRKSSLDPEDPLWKKALVFVSRTQNRSESNDQEWAANDGGFTYMPGYSPHGGTASYGGMTHAGLISLIFAGVDRSDPRVQAAYDWIRAHYTLDENPGVKGKQGLFYYYTAFAKSMYAFGEPEVVDHDGIRHNWRNDLARKLLSYQGEDGSWVNPYSSRWWEGVKELITARSVIALNLAVR